MSVRGAYPAICRQISLHDYTADPPQWQELRPNHFVLCNAAEAAQWIREL